MCGLRKDFTRNVEGRRTTFGRFLLSAHHALNSLETGAGNDAVALNDVARRKQLFAQIYAEVTLFVAERLRRGLGASSVWARPLRLVWARRRDRGNSYWPAMLLAYMGSPDPVLPSVPTPRRDFSSPGAVRSENTLTACGCSPHSYIQAVNYKRIPDYMRSILDENIQNMRRVLPPDKDRSFMLVEFFGVHDFAWVHKECVLPFVSAEKSPNEKPIRHNQYKAAQLEIADMLKCTDLRVLTVLKNTFESIDVGSRAKSGTGPIAPMRTFAALEQCLREREEGLLARWSEHGPGVALGDLHWLAWKTADDDDDITEGIGFLPDEGDYDSGTGRGCNGKRNNNDVLCGTNFENAHAMLMHQAAAARTLLIHEGMLNKIAEFERPHHSNSKA